MSIAEIDHFEGTLSPLSSANADDDSFGLVCIQWQAVQSEPPVNWLEAVGQQRESSLVVQRNVQLSVVCALFIYYC